MFLENLSLRNFGSFGSADFSFPENGLSVIYGANGTGKSQILGAMLAALVGRAAVKLEKTGIGPSEVRLAIKDKDTTENLFLSVSLNQQGEAIVDQVCRPPGANDDPGSLRSHLLTAISDRSGPCILIPRDLSGTRLTSAEIIEIEKLLPDELKRDQTWLRFCSGEASGRFLRSGEEAELTILLGEFAKRKRSQLQLPLLVDEFLWKLSNEHLAFALKILESIAKTSQVIVLSHVRGAFSGAVVTSLDAARPRVRTLAYYNYFVENQRPNLTTRKQHKWVHGRLFGRQEDRTCELKEVKGADPIGSIKNVVDQYVVAFLNAQLLQDGAIFWGIRNEDLAIVGVKLSNQQCDALRRAITEKLHQISPPLSPIAFQVNLHPVSDGSEYIRDLYVVEVRVPAVRRVLLFSTGSHEVYIKTDAGKKKLSAMELQQELLRRFGIDPTF